MKRWDRNGLPAQLGQLKTGQDGKAGLSHSFLGMGPGPLELGKIASF